MTPKLPSLFCLLVCAVLPGCTLCKNAKRTILDEPSVFSWMEDREQSLETYRTWADRAWREECSLDPEQSVSRAYVEGFKDGFVDYVYAGGSGEPPPVPPRQFWNVDVRNPRGHSEAADWFAGYRHGSQLAREAGYRKRALVPSSLFLFGSRENDWEDDWEQEPSYVENFSEPIAPLIEEPIAEPIAEPLLPEFVSPLPEQPAARTEASEPELPKLETPAAEMPKVEIPAIEEVPEAEKLPQPVEAPPQPQPIESPVEDVRPPLDVDEIFDSPTLDLRTQKSQELRRMQLEKGARQDAAVQQARFAFAKAIRKRQGTTQSSSGMRLLHQPNNSKLIPLQREETAEETASTTAALSQFNSTNTAIPTRRPATIPRSEDRAEEMFRRLSH